VFYAFHGKERFDAGHGHDAHDTHGHAPHESPAVITVPLVLLAIPSIISGWVIGRVVFGDYFGGAIVVSPAHEWIAEMAHEFPGVIGMMLHGLTSLPFWFAVAGLATAWYLYILRPELPAVIREKAGLLTTILERKYGFDEFNQWFFANGAVKFGTGLWKIGDVTLIDGVMVNGSAKLVGWVTGIVREIQSGRIYHYAFSMIFGVFVLLTLFGMLAAG